MARCITCGRRFEPEIHRDGATIYQSVYCGDCTAESPLLSLIVMERDIDDS